MDAVSGDVGVGGKLHLRISNVGLGGVVADTAQRPERGVVAETVFGQLLIEAVRVDGVDTRHRWKHGPGLLLGGQSAARVQGPDEKDANDRYFAGCRRRRRIQSPAWP